MNYRVGDRVSLDPKAAQRQGFGGVVVGQITAVDYEQVLVRPEGGRPYSERPFTRDQLQITRQRLSPGDRVAPKDHPEQLGRGLEIEWCSRADGTLGWHLKVRWDEGGVVWEPVDRLVRLGIEADLPA